VLPHGPSAAPAASASGVVECASACRTPWAELHAEVEHRDAAEPEEDAARDGARRIAQLAARHDRVLDAGEGEEQHDRGPRDRRRGRCLRDDEVRGVDREDAERDEDEQGDELRDRGDAAQARAVAHAEHVHDREEGEGGDEPQRASRRRRERRHHRRDVPDEDVADRGDRRDADEPGHDARHEARERTEGALDVRVRSSRGGDTAAGLCEAEADHRHDRGADDEREGRGRSERCGDLAREAEDPAARPRPDVHDAAA
jgi:hypothetical protein